MELDGVTVFRGGEGAVLAFPRADGDLAGAVRLARESGASEVGCWAIAPDDELGRRLEELGFQDGWQPHWMGIDPREVDGSSGHHVEETSRCATGLPYWSEAHERVLGGDVRHFVVGYADATVGHVVLNIDDESGGIYDMGVARHARRQGYGKALTLAALKCARESGCASVTLNATPEGELLYRSVGFESLGLGMTWWLFPHRACGAD